MGALLHGFAAAPDSCGVQGRVRVNDIIELPEQKVQRKVKSIQVFKQSVASCQQVRLHPCCPQSSWVHSSRAAASVLAPGRRCSKQPGAQTPALECHAWRHMEA